MTSILAATSILVNQQTDPALDSIVELSDGPWVRKAKTTAQSKDSGVVASLDSGWRDRLRTQIERVKVEGIDGRGGDTYERISDRSGRSRGWAAQFVRGEIRDIEVESLFRLCHEGLGHVSPYWILTGAGQPMDPPPPPIDGALADALQQRNASRFVRLAAGLLVEREPALAELDADEWLEIVDALIEADRRAGEDVERILRFAGVRRAEHLARVRRKERAVAATSPTPRPVPPKKR